MNFNCKSLFILLLSLCFIPHLIAQGNEVERSENSIKKIKNGVLIVRLGSKSNKVKELSRLISSPEVSSNSKDDLKRILHETVSEVKSFNTKMYYAFTEVYDFSEVLFLYDTASISLKNGLQQGYFLDENLKVDPIISLNNRSYCILRFGRTDPGETSGVEALVFMDDQFKDLTKPFPYYMKLKSLGQKLSSIFSSRSSSQIKVVKRVNKLNENLKKYYSKVMATSSSLE